MMRTGYLLAGLACLAAAGCNTVKKADMRPGGSVVTEDKAISWMSDLSGNPAGHNRWIFVRVIAPAGATACQADDSWFDGVNPYPKARVDADGAALLTVRNEIDEAGFSCSTLSGVVRRKIASEKFEYSYLNYNRTKRTDRSFWIVPPMVHMDPSDPQAAARWDRLQAELCAGDRIAGIAACRPGVMQNMKLRDLAS